MPIEENDEIIRLNADKKLVCEVNARTLTFPEAAAINWFLNVTGQRRSIKAATS